MMARKKDMWDGDAEFSFNISEEEFNKRHKKARKDAEPSGKYKPLYRVSFLNLKDV